MIIPIYFEGMKLRAMVDTGAERSILNPRLTPLRDCGCLLDFIDREKYPIKQMMRLIDGGLFSANYAVTLRTRVGDWT